MATKLQATIVATTTTEVTIAPKVRLKLLSELKAYQRLKQSADEIEAQMKAHKETIDSIRHETGHESIAIDGFKTTLVAPVRSKLDKKLFVRLGGKLDLLEKATTKTPGTSYTKITCPGQTERFEEE